MQTKPTEQDSQARMMRGLEMLQNGATITELESGAFAVPSQTGAKTYEVRILGERMVCTCPDFEYRQIEACKHIHLVKFTLSVRHLRDEPKPKVFAADAIPCTKCGSIRVIRYGIAGVQNVKQIYRCKDCGTKFREPSMLNKVKFSPELITLTLDLYFSGLSLRKVARNVSDHLHIDVGYTTIYSWIKRYVPMIVEYVNTLTPELSKEWHADELFVKTRGCNSYKGTKGIGFLWNVMDRQTRYLIASKLTEHRDANGAIAAFQEAIKNAHNRDPEIVYTDALRPYMQAVPEFFPNKKITHVANCGIGKQPHETNNRIERMNGTLRERVKVQRGWKKIETPLADGQRIQYNFVKPHMALKGKTPAQIAGLNIEGENKWLALIKAARDTSHK